MSSYGSQLHVGRLCDYRPESHPYVIHDLHRHAIYYKLEKKHYKYREKILDAFTEKLREIPRIKTFGIAMINSCLIRVKLHLKVDAFHTSTCYKCSRRVSVDRTGCCDICQRSLEPQEADEFEARFIADHSLQPILDEGAVLPLFIDVRIIVQARRIPWRHINHDIGASVRLVRNIFNR